MQNILIHAINGIGLGHIRRTLLLANILKDKKYIGDIIFVTNSKNPFLIKNEGYKIFNLDYGIEDTLNGLKFQEFEEKSFNKINQIIIDNKIDIIIHDTHFIKMLISKRVDLKHFLILRDSELDYLESIKNLLYRFKKIYIPHLKDELNEKKISFYNKYNNIKFINYIVGDISKKIKKNKIIISPGYGGDYENTKKFFIYVNELLQKNENLIIDYEIKFIIGKHFEKIKDEINFIKNSEILNFVDNLNDELGDCKIFIGRGGYNTLNEVIINNCNSLLFEVERFGENQAGRIDFFINNLGLKNIKKGKYDFNKDIELLNYLLQNKIKSNELNDIFNGVNNFSNDFEIEFKKQNILIFKHIFLPISENFIHEELTNFKEFNPIIITLDKINQDIFFNNLEILYFDEFKYLLNYEYPKILNNELYLKFLKFIVFVIKKYDIKIIYTEFLFDSFFIIKIKNIIPNIKIISAGRGYDVYTFLKKDYFNSKVFLNKLDKILVRDNLMYNEILNYGVNENCIDIVRSVIDFSKYNFENKNFSKFDIIFGGRFTQKKNIIELLDLILLLSRENFVGKIGLIGDGDLKKEILNKIENLGLKNKIKYYGFLNHRDFLLKLKEYNCFINYSKIANNGDNEGLNNMISENILFGNIVFSTIVGGIGEIIQDNLTGITLSGNPKKDFVKIKKTYDIKNFNKIIENGFLHINKILGIEQSIEKLENIIKLCK